MRRNPGHSPLSWRGPTKESSLPAARRARCALLVLAAVGFAWLLTPRIYGPFTDHLHKEDGLIFLSGDQAGESLLTTYTGYLHVGPRLVTQTCAAAPPEAFATCVAGGSAGFRVALMVLVFAVLSPYVRRWGWALGAAGLVIFGGIGQQEVLGNVTNLRWFLDTAATMALLGSFKRLGLIILASALLILGVLSDPLALLLAPVALWRLLALDGRAKFVPALYFPAAALHIALLKPEARGSYLPEFFMDPLINTQNMVVRSLTEAVLGETGTTVALAIAGPLAVTVLTIVAFALLYFTGFRRLDGQQKWMTVLLAAAGFLFLVATVNFMDPHEIDVAHGVARASRYALIPSLMVGASLAVLFSEYPRTAWGRSVRAATVGLILVGSAADSRGDEWATRGPSWSATVEETRQACEGGAETLTVEVTPQGVPTEWTADLNCSWVTPQAD